MEFVNVQMEKISVPKKKTEFHYKHCVYVGHGYWVDIAQLLSYRGW